MKFVGAGRRCYGSPTSVAQQLRSVGVPGPEGSIGKAAAADFNKDVSEFLASTILGAEGMLKPDGYPMGPTQAHDAVVEPTRSRRSLRMRANSIEGGTTEIMKNILGERVLGPPGRRPRRQGTSLEAKSPAARGAGADVGVLVDRLHLTVSRARREHA